MKILRCELRETLYFKGFGRERPEVVISVEERAKAQRASGRTRLAPSSRIDSKRIDELDVSEMLFVAGDDDAVVCFRDRRDDGIERAAGATFRLAVLSFGSDDEGGGGWVEEDEAAGQLASVIPLRAELARGDLRALYLGWLLCAQSGELGDDDIEPPVPAGLADLSPALDSFAEFLRIDPDLIAAAAAASPPLAGVDLEPAEVRAWLAKLAIAEKDELLARLIIDHDASLTDELVQRMRRERGDDHGAGATARWRSVAELLRAGEQAAEERERIAAAKAAKEKEKRERAAALARAKHLDQLAGKESTLWAQVHSFVAIMKPKGYDQAIELLVDLRDLAVRTDADDFRERLDALRTAHAGKRTFIDRLSKAVL